MNSKQLKNIIPYAGDKNIEKFIPEFNKVMPMFEINTPLRISHFVAQVAHESGSLNYVKELASGKAYEGREELGNVIPGDGVKYKGRGLIQLTGRANYESFKKWLGGLPDIIDNPELLEQPHLAMLVSCWFWEKKGLNELADQDNLSAITKRINGGMNGFSERQKFLTRAKKEFIWVK